MAMHIVFSISQTRTTMIPGPGGEALSKTEKLCPVPKSFLTYGEAEKEIEYLPPGVYQIEKSFIVLNQTNQHDNNKKSGEVRKEESHY